MDKNIIFVKHKTQHHASHSGYTKLLNFIPGESIPNNDIFFTPYRVRKAISGFISQDAGIYNSESIKKEVLLAWLMLTRKKHIVHFLNGERDIRFTTFIKNLRSWKMVATFHKPPEILKKTITSYKYLKKIDGAIAVGINQLDFLRETLKNENVVYIPHGIDTDFFTPSNIEWQKNTCIFVGQHLRDFKGLEACISIIKKHVPNFRLRAVLNPKYVHLLPKSPLIEVYSGISDEYLRKLYQSSSALLLPLSDSTACNSILESLSCGLPIITNAVGGITGYLDNSCSFVFKANDSKGMAEAAIHLMENENINFHMRQNAREKSLEFDWHIIAEQLISFYKNLIESKFRK